MCLDRSPDTMKKLWSWNLFGWVFYVILGIVFWKKKYGLYHGKSLPNHHWGEYETLFPCIFSKSKLMLPLEVLIHCVFPIWWLERFVAVSHSFQVHPETCGRWTHLNLFFKMAWNHHLVRIWGCNDWGVNTKKNTALCSALPFSGARCC